MTPRHCLKATWVLQDLHYELGLTLYPTKSEWVGAMRVEHLVVVIDTNEGRFFIVLRKLARIRSIAKKIIWSCNNGRSWVTASTVPSVVGSCVSVSLSKPFSRLYTRSLKLWSRPWVTQHATRALGCNTG